MVQRKIVEKIKAYDTIIVHRHVRPDPDAIGSQVGLKKMIELSFPEKKVYAVGEEDPSLHFFARMDEVTDETFEDALIIICDTANTGRISDKRYSMGKEIIKIDHHPIVDEYGDLSWVDTTASSTSELIYELYLSDKNTWKLNAEVARLIYGGIVGDTGRFLFPSTSNKTFRYASELIEYEFDRQALYDGLYEVDLNIARLRGYVLQNLTVSDSGMSAIKITEETLEKFNVDAMQTSKLVGLLGEIKGVCAWAFFIEEPDVIRVRLRSKGPVINELAEKYNGGGHPMASGATVYSWEEAEALIKELDELCRNQ